MDRSTFKKILIIALVVVLVIATALMIFSFVVKIDTNDVIAYGISPFVFYPYSEPYTPTAKLIFDKDEIRKMSENINDFQKVRLFSLEDFSTTSFEGYIGEQSAFIRLLIYVEGDVSVLTVYDSGGLSYKGQSFVYGSKANGIKLYDYLLNEYRKISE